MTNPDPKPSPIAEEINRSLLARYQTLADHRQAAAGTVELITCALCEHRFDAKLGRYGCPNCHAEGLDTDGTEPAKTPNHD